MTSTKHVIALHELRHLAGFAVAIADSTTDRPQYESVKALIHVTDNTGEAAVDSPDWISDRRLAAHGAVGPLAANRKLVEIGIDEALAGDHDLSPSDLQRIEASDVSRFNLLVTARAVQILEDRIGETKFAALARIVSRSSAACDGEMPLSALFPAVPVREALQQARKELVEPPVVQMSKARFDRMNPLEKLNTPGKIEVTRC